MGQSKKHTHKYHRIPINGNNLWACALPDCNHYMPKSIEKMVEGKNSYCFSCSNIFILDSEAMKRDKPLCFDCANPRLINADLMDILSK